VHGLVLGGAQTVCSTHMVSVSAIGLIFSSIPITVHGPEVLFPSYVRFIANIFPAFSARPFPVSPDEWIAYEDGIKMLSAAKAALCPRKGACPKAETAEDYVFILGFEQRQAACLHVVSAVAALYASGLPLAQRHPLHLIFFLAAVIMAAVNLNQAGVMPFGSHPFVSSGGRNLGLAFGPFWIAAAIFNFKGFKASVAAANAKSSSRPPSPRTSPRKEY